MSKDKAFLAYERIKEPNRAPQERIKDYREFSIALPEEQLEKQAERCMSCGTPFCHSGCPLGNLIPDFNNAVSRKNWQAALDILHATNNFPEFTGRLCPAPCETACVLGIIKPPVAIEYIEKYIVEMGFKNNWIRPNPPKFRTGRRVAIIGSGPAGLAAAQQLNRAGHSVTVFERDARPGGLLRYGIPNFKLEKNVIDRRLSLLEAEGVRFQTNAHIGVNVPIQKLEAFNATLLAGGATVRRMLSLPGANLQGVIQAMDFLKNQNQIIEQTADSDAAYNLHGKHVIVIGGGDTGADCIGTANRKGAASVVNFEVMPQPPTERTAENPWPYWPYTFKTASSHEEGVKREFLILTKEFIGDANGRLKALKTVRVAWEKTSDGPLALKEIPGSEKEWPCDVVLLALGFTGPEKTLSEQLGLALDARTNIKSDAGYCTNLPNVFVAGDMRRGQSLVVWAISEGREAAYHIDAHLMRNSHLPIKEKGDLPLAQ